MTNLAQQLAVIRRRDFELSEKLKSALLEYMLDPDSDEFRKKILKSLISEMEAAGLEQTHEILKTIEKHWRN